jgi:hypothetical protein
MKLICVTEATYISDYAAVFIADIRKLKSVIVVLFCSNINILLLLDKEKKRDKKGSFIPEA